MSRLKKKIQYAMCILMVCLLLVPPAVAMEASGSADANQVENIVGDLTPPSAEDPPGTSALAQTQATEPVILF